MTEKIQHRTLDYIFCDEFTILRDLQYKATQATYGSADSEGKHMIILTLFQTVPILRAGISSEEARGQARAANQRAIRQRSRGTRDFSGLQ